MPCDQDHDNFWEGGGECEVRGREMLLMLAEAGELHR